MANFKISGKNVFTQTGSEEPALANNVSIPAITEVGLKSIKPISNQDLTGTYADHEMIIGDKFTLTGDLTINDNLVLASLSGSGQDIIITDDGNGRTITTAGKVISCTTTNTDATVTTASTTDLRAGIGVTGTGIPASTTILSITNATTFELSAAATASGTVDLTFDTAVFEGGEFLGTAALPTIGDLSGTLANAVQDNITRLGDVAVADIPYQLTTGRREIQSAYGFDDSNVTQVVSNSNTNTMTGAPYTRKTFALDTGSATNTVWKIEGYAGVNNESGAQDWNCSMKFWVSYDNGSSWVDAIPGHGNSGDYMWYSSSSGAGDEYTYINGAVWVTGTGGAAMTGCDRITSNQPNTVFGMALYSAESDNTRWNMVDSMGVWIHVTQYQL